MVELALKELMLAMVVVVLGMVWLLVFSYFVRVG